MAIAQTQGPGPLATDETATREVLTFFIEGQEFGVEILAVQEIRQWTPITRLPNAPDHVRGVINIRGTIVPVIEPKLLFGLEPREYSKFTVVVVLRIDAPDKERHAGLIVDGVSDVYRVTDAQIKNADDFGNYEGDRHTAGIITLEDRMLILLDVAKVFEFDLGTD